jgi:hypothetical protein
LSQVCGDHRKSNPATLRGGNEYSKVAIARKQYDFVNVLGKLNRIDGKFNAELILAPAGSFGEFCRLGDNGEAIVSEPVEQGPERRGLTLVEHRRVIVGAYDLATTLKFAKKTLKIKIEAERPCS